MGDKIDLKIVCVLMITTKEIIATSSSVGNKSFVSPNNGTSIDSGSSHTVSKKTYGNAFFLMVKIAESRMKTSMEINIFPQPAKGKTNKRTLVQVARIPKKRLWFSAAFIFIFQG